MPVVRVWALFLLGGIVIGISSPIRGRLYEALHFPVRSMDDYAPPGLPIPAGAFLLLETGDYLLLENSKIILSENGNTAQPIISGPDDGDYDDGGGFDNTAVDVDLGNDAGTAKTGYFYFASTGIPQGSTIVTAYLRVTSAANLADVTVNLLLVGSDEDEAAVPQNKVDAAARPRTTAETYWNNLEAWVADTVYESPSIKAIIQEIVDRAGFAGPILLFVEDNGSTVASKRKVKSYNGDPTAAAELVVQYWAPSTEIPATTQTVSIDNAGGGALIDYQVLVTVPFMEGMQPDFSDIRFRDSDDTTLLDFWLEIYTIGDWARFWVKVPTVGAGTTKNIYLHFGDVGATGGSDGDATFLFFDDFGNIEGWVEDSGNPLLEKGAGGSWDDNWVGDPSVINDGGTYRMWYYGFDGANAQEGYAEAASPEGPWVKGPGNPVLTIGAGGTWDDVHAHKLSVVYRGGTFHGVYAGDDGATRALGYASRTDADPDGAWTKGGSNPILSPTLPAEDNYYDAPFLRYCDTHSRWEMYYASGLVGGEGENINFAYCSGDPSNPANWTKYAGNPIITPSGDGWQSLGIGALKVYESGGILYAMYTAFDTVANICRVGLATSTDEVTWTLDPSDLIIDMGDSGTWTDDTVYTGTIMQDGSDWLIWANARTGTVEAIGLWQLTADVGLLDTGKWYKSVYAGTFSLVVEGGHLVLSQTASPGGDALMVSTVDYEQPQDTIVEMCAKHTWDSGDANATQGYIAFTGSAAFASANNRQEMFWDNTGNEVRHQSKSGGVLGGEDTIYAAVPTTQSWYIARIVKRAAAMDYYFLDLWRTSLGSLLANADAPQGFSYRGGPYVILSEQWIDWWLVRKYASPEPTVTIL